METVPGTETYFYLFNSVQSSSPVGSEPGEEISPKSTKPNPKNIYEGINNLESSQSNKLGLGSSFILVTVDCFALEKHRLFILFIPDIRVKCSILYELSGCMFALLSM